MDKTTFQHSLAYLAAAFDVELTPERAAVYWDQLGSLRDDAFRRACTLAVSSEPRFPTVARLREVYHDVLRQQAMTAPRLPAGTRPEREKIARLMHKLKAQLRR